ncbi:MAG: GyrI-like domain-containing protein [Gammaproteobacteria bacterium]|jgi:predicted transcriptional regulator YdeE|nr:GyrI-like domain-containing protein [Gammaproteobacteria bacterium]
MPTPPVALHIPAFHISGVSVRTSNRDEMDPATARLGALWDAFFSQSWERKLPSAGHHRRIFGVYSAYESNEQGAFDVTAGVSAQAPSDENDGAPSAPDAPRVVSVEAGHYLVFHGQGTMPQMVIDTWGEIWRYFAANPQVQRRFATDFEAYDGPDQVAIHIGIVA